MGNKINLNTVFIGLVFISISCHPGQDTLEKVFSKQDLQGIHVIINFYDNYVQANTHTSLPMAEAYLSFMEKNRPSPSSKGDPDIFYINSNDRNEFLRTVDHNLLLEIYNTHDSTVTFNPKTKERIVIHPPFHLS